MVDSDTKFEFFNWEAQRPNGKCAGLQIEWTGSWAINFTLTELPFTQVYKGY